MTAARIGTMGTSPDRGRGELTTLRTEVEEHFRGLRDPHLRAARELESSGAKFRRTAWQRPAAAAAK